MAGTEWEWLCATCFRGQGVHASVLVPTELSSSAFTGTRTTARETSVPACLHPNGSSEEQAPAPPESGGSECDGAAEYPQTGALGPSTSHCSLQGSGRAVLLTNKEKDLLPTAPSEACLLPGEPSPGPRVMLLSEVSPLLTQLPSCQVQPPA